MSIIQISKIQQRSGNIVDLPQLDEAEFGFASDAKRLYIGKVSPNENIEVLTSYSNISFSQIEGAVGNLDISAISADNGQVLTYDGTNWVNRGGDAGGVIDLGDVSNVRIDGGAIGYVLETDGTGNLSWTPKSTIVAYIANISNASPAVVTTTEDNFFTDGAAVTFTNLPGISGSVGFNLNGDTLYANVLTSNTFSLYTDSGLTTPYNASGDTAFPNTTVTDTSASNNRVTVGSSTPFSLNDPIKFIGTMFGVLDSNTTYYVKAKPTSTTITLSLEPGGTTLILTTASGSCRVYATGGRVITDVGGSGTTLIAAGASQTVQFNNSGVLTGSSDFTFTSGATSILALNGNANVGNLNATSSVIASTLTSNISTGTAPLTVTSTTRVANLNVSYSNVSDFGVVTAQTTGTFFPVFVNGSSTANRALGANANLGFNAATGNLSATVLYANSTITAVGNIVGANVNTAGNVTASRLISNVATGTAPLTVTSTTRVANLNVAHANVADFVNIADVTTGTFYPILANAATGNISEGSNANLTFNAATGALNATLLGGTLTTAAQPNITSLGTLTSLTVSGTMTANDIATFGTAGDTLNITGAGNTNVNGAGGIINIAAAQGNGTGQGGNLTLAGGSANSSGNAAGGLATLTAGNGYGQGQGGTVGIYSGASANTYGAKGGNIVITGGTYDGAGGDMELSGGEAAGQNHVGGDITIKSGASTGSAAVGRIIFQTSTVGSTGNTVQTLSDRIIIDDTQMNVRFTTASSSTTTGALEVAGGVGVGGNVYALAFYGAATGLTSIPGANVSGTVANATHASTANTVTNSTQSNITSVGTLLGLNVSTGSLTATTPILIEQTWNNSSVAFTGIRENITDTSSAAGSFLLDLQVGGTSQFVVYKNGNLNVGPSSTGNIAAASIQVTTLTTGANTTAGSVTGNWTLTAGSRFNATYADLAEYYEADREYEAGTVLEFGGDKEVTLAEDATTRVAGVVSTDPAFAMNAKCQGMAVPIALQGRVPVKVRGNIRKGDMMISGGNGYARPAPSNPIIGTIIGKALENFNGADGVIEIAIGRL
jgi:hypothetical protein